MIVRRERKRNQHGRLARRRQFGNRARPRAADNQIRPRKSGRHVGQECRHLPLQPGSRELRNQFVLHQGPRLMNKAHRQPGLPEQRPALARRYVQRSRTLTAPRNQHRELLFLRLRPQLKKLPPHRQTRQFRAPSRKKPRRFREADQRLLHPPGDPAIRRARHGVRLHNHHRHAAQQRRQCRRTRHVTAHAEHRRRTPFPKPLPLRRRFRHQTP